MGFNSAFKGLIRSEQW